MKRAPVVNRGCIRSTRKVRQSERPASQATRYQRCPVWTSRCGSTKRAVSAPGMVTIAEAQHLKIPAGARDRGQRARVHGAGCAGGGHDHGLHRRHAAAQPRRQDLLDLRERPHRGLFDSLDGPRSGVAQADRHGHRFFVVQQQGRHRGSGAQLIPAFRARGGVNWITQGPQLVDVAPQRSAGDLKPPREIPAGPIPATLKQ